MLRYPAIFLSFIVIMACLVPSVRSTPEEASDLYQKTSFTWLPAESEDGINLCYRLILLVQMDLALSDPDLQAIAMGYAEEILLRQKASGEVMAQRDVNNVNSKLMTGLGAWALSAAYSYTGEERYASAARLAADYLIDEMEEWESAYPAECDDPRTRLARNQGANESALTSYCWTSPNDLGLVALGIGSVVYYGAGGKDYYDACCKLADALYDMQLSDGSWYDGYAYKIPTRWDRSVHYVTMSMMGLWMAYKISGSERYSGALGQAWEWMQGMQCGSGAVYDIWVDDENLSKAPSSGDNRFDFLQVGGDTNVKEYFDYPFKTYLGEFSFVLSGAFMSNVGLPSEGYLLTKGYLQGRLVISNWYLLSLTMEVNEPILPYWAGTAGIFAMQCSLALGKNDAQGPGNGSLYVILSGSAILLSYILYLMIIKRRAR